MKKFSLKIRKGIANRFFISANELPHSIDYKGIESGWNVFICKSASHSFEIGYKELYNQFIKF